MKKIDDKEKTAGILGLLIASKNYHLPHRLIGTTLSLKFYFNRRLV